MSNQPTEDVNSHQQQAQPAEKQPGETLNLLQQKGSSMELPQMQAGSCK